MVLIARYGRILAAATLGRAVAARKEVEGEDADATPRTRGSIGALLTKAPTLDV